MATSANIFTLKLENKDFNAQLQTAAKTSQDYNNKIANSLLEAAKQEAKLVTLLKDKAQAQREVNIATASVKSAKDPIPQLKEKLALLKEELKLHTDLEIKLGLSEVISSKTKQLSDAKDTLIAKKEALAVSRAAVVSKTNEISVTNSLIQSENAAIKANERKIAIELENAKQIIAKDRELIQSKQELALATQRQSEAATKWSNTVNEANKKRTAFETANIEKQNAPLVAKKQEVSQGIKQWFEQDTAREVAVAKHAETEKANFAISERARMIASLTRQGISFEESERLREQRVTTLMKRFTEERIALATRRAKREQELANETSRVEATSTQKAKEKTDFVNTYVNTSAQNKYNASLAELNRLKSQGIISEVEYSKAVKKTNEALKQGAPERDNQFNHMIRMMRWAGTLAAAFYGVKTAWDATIGKGIELGRQIEDMGMGISALTAANASSVSSTGNAMNAMDKFRAASKMTVGTMIQLRKAAVDTPASFSEIASIFQQAYVSTSKMGDGFGLTTQSVIKNTVELSTRMANIAGAIGMPMQKALEETRSLMSGQASGDSLIASLLFGSPAQANEAMRKAQEGGALEVKKMLDGVMESFDVLAKVETYTKSLAQAKGAYENLVTKIAEPIKNDLAKVFDQFAKSFTDAKVAEMADDFKSLYDGMKNVASVMSNLAVPVTIAAGLWGIAKAYNGILLAATLAARHPLIAATLVVSTVGADIVKQYDDALAKRTGKTPLPVSALEDQTTNRRNLATSIKAEETIKARVDLLKKGGKYASEIEATLAKGFGKLTGVLGVASPLEIEINNLKKAQIETKKYQEQVNKWDAKFAPNKTTSTTDLQKALVTEGTDYYDKSPTIVAAKLASERLRLVKQVTDVEIAISTLNVIQEQTKPGSQHKENEKQLIVYKNSLKQKQIILEQFDKEQADKSSKITTAAAAKAEAAHNKENRRQLSAMEKLQQFQQTEMVGAQMVEAIKSANYNLDKSQLTDIQRLKLSQLDIAEKGLNEELTATNRVTDTALRNFEVQQVLEKIYKNRTEHAETLLGLEQKLSDEQEKQSTALEKSMLKSYETRVKLRALEDSSKPESASFERVFGTSKISPDTGASLIRKEKLDFNWTKQGLFGDELDKAQADFDARIAHIKNKIVEIPPIELKVELKGWDEVSNTMGGIITSVVGLNKASETYNTTLAVLETRHAKEAKDSVKWKKTNKDIANLKANNAQDELSTYADLTHAVSTFAKVGSKEQKALLQVEQGIHMAKMAMSIQALVMDEAMTAKQIALSGARATADGIAAIAKTIASLPFPYNLVAGAAVAAALVATGVKMFGGGGGNGSGGQSVYTSNTGTVLGDSSAISESMTNVTTLLSDIHTAEYSELRDINRAVTSMSQGIEGAVTSIFKTGILDTSGIQLSSTVGALGSIGLGSLGSSKQYIAGSGFNIESGTLGSKAGGNVGASTFVDVETAKKNWIGQASYSHKITTTALDSASSQSIALIYKSFSDTMLEINEGLGTDLAPAITNYTMGAIKLSTAGKTGEEAVQALNDAFSAMGDKMSSDVFGALLNQYQKLGEGLLETGVRVITEKAVVIQDLGDIGKTVNGDIISVSQSLITLAGTLGDFQDSVASYYDKYFTDAEKQANTQRHLAETFNSFNAELTDLGEPMMDLSMPTTTEQFRRLVDSLNLSTEEGQKAYTMLMQVSTTFSDFSETLVASMEDIVNEAQTLSDAFTSMSDSIQETIDKLLSTGSGTTQSTMIGSFWEKRAQADLLLAKRGDLTVKEEGTLSGLVSDLDSLALSIQGAQIGGTGGITSSLVGQLQDLKASVVLDNIIVQSRILDANGAAVSVATEGTLTRLTNAIIDRNALLGIDGSHANGLTSVPYDGYIAELHKGERVLTASEANGFGGRTIVNFNTSALEAINNKMYDRIDKIYGILNDAQLGVRPLFIRAN